MATALFGPDRLTYWRDALSASTGHEQQHRAPVRARIGDLDREIAGLDRRLRRQILNLEDDDVTPAARRQITTRIAELEDALNRHHATRKALRAELTVLPPDPDQIAELLELLPDLAGQLPDLPRRALRHLYDALDLKISYHPGVPHRRHRNHPDRHNRRHIHLSPTRSSGGAIVAGLVGAPREETNLHVMIESPAPLSC